MSDIQPGDVVVCVGVHKSTCPYARGGPLRILKEGRHYVVADVRPTHRCDDIFLVGIEPPICPGVLRKLNDGEGDADALERIRKCKPAREPALATRLDAGDRS